MLSLLLPFQRLFVPAIIILLVWSSYRLVFKKDRAVGLALYLSLVIVVDSFYNTGIFIPGLKAGSIRYSEVCAFFLLINNPPGKPAERGYNLIFVLVFIYFLLFFYSGLRGYDTLLGFFEFRRYVIPQIIALAISYRGFERKEDYQRFALSLMALVILIGLFTFWDVFFDRWILKSETLNAKVYWASRRNGRFGSLFLNPNYLGGFAALTFPLLFINTLLEKRPWLKLLCWTGILAFAFAFVETQSRGPMLGFLAAILTFVAIPTRKITVSRKLGYLLLFMAAIYIVMPGFFEHAVERFRFLSMETSTEHLSRRTLWAFTMGVVYDNPLFGIGFGEETYIKYLTEQGFIEKFGAFPLHNPHNSYLEMAVFAGVPAALSFIAFSVMVIQKSFRFILVRKDNPASFYLMALTAGMVGFMVCLVMDMQMFTTSVAPAYWIVFGLMLSIIRSPGRFEAT